MKNLEPYKGTESYIFISYSHKDKDEVLSVLEPMVETGYRVWFDEGIDPGTEWDENIAKHVEDCDALIAFISGNYISSDNCKDELNYARDLKKDRLLIYLEKTDLPSGMAMRLNRLQAIHKYTYKNKKDFFQKLFSAPMVERNKGICQVFSTTSNSVDDMCFEDYHSSDLTRIEDNAESPVGNGFNGWEDASIATKKYELSTAWHIPFFADEVFAEKLIKIRHWNLCRIFEIVREGPYITMEFVPGVTLKEYYERNEFHPHETMNIVRDILCGLYALHNEEIIYGDVSPDNIIISAGRACLCDFSESYYTGTKGPDLTITLDEFKSPERVKGDKRDFRSDIYETGVILRTLLNKTYILDDRAKHAIYKIVLKATERDIEARYSSVEEMIRDIDDILEKI